MTCLVSTNVAGPCAACGTQLNGAHLVDREVGETKVERLAIYCRECCVVCSPKFPEWAGPPKTISGEQGVLF